MTRELSENWVRSNGVAQRILMHFMRREFLEYFGEEWRGATPLPRY